MELAENPYGIPIAIVGHPSEIPMTPYRLPEEFVEHPCGIPIRSLQK